MKCTTEHLLDAVAPRIDLPKLQISVVDPVAFAAKCAAKGTTPAEEMQRIIDLLTPPESEGFS